MEVNAKLRHLHMSPRKVRRVAHVLKGMPVPRAQAELLHRPERAAEPLAKLLKSAVANANDLSDAQEETMKVVNVTVTEGTRMKRFRPRSRGMVHPYVKRMSHVYIVLDVPGERKAKEEAEAPVKIDPEADKREDAPADEDAPKGDQKQAPARRDARSDRKAIREERERTTVPRLKRIFRRKSM